MREHTPGPWRYEYGAVYATKAPDREPGARVDVRIGLADREETFTDPSERDANVQLMAAAPELLDALRQVSECARLTQAFSAANALWNIEATILAAIAKAVES